MRFVPFHNAFVRLNSVELAGRDGGRGCVRFVSRRHALDSRRENCRWAESMERTSTSMWSAIALRPRRFSKPFLPSTFSPPVRSLEARFADPLSFMVHSEASCSRAMGPVRHGAATATAFSALFAPLLQRDEGGVCLRTSEGSDGGTSSCPSPWGRETHGKKPFIGRSDASYGVPLTGRRSSSPSIPSCGGTACGGNAFFEPHRSFSSQTFPPSLGGERHHTETEGRKGRHKDGPSTGVSEAATTDDRNAEPTMPSSSGLDPRPAPSTFVDASPFLLPFPAIVKASRQRSQEGDARLPSSCMCGTTRLSRKPHEAEEEGVSPLAPEEARGSPHDPLWIASGSSLHAGVQCSAPLPPSSECIERKREEWPPAPPQVEKGPSRRPPLAFSSFSSSHGPCRCLPGGEEAAWPGSLPTLSSPVLAHPDPFTSPRPRLTAPVAAPHAFLGVVEANHEEMNVPVPSDDDDDESAASPVVVRVAREASLVDTVTVTHRRREADASTHEEADPDTHKPVRKKTRKEKKEKWWVLNRFSRRVVSATSPSLQDLSGWLGIGPCPLSRQLVLQHPSALESFARALRAKEVSWPLGWRSAEFFRLRRLLESTEAAAVVQKVHDFLNEPPPAPSTSTTSSLCTTALVSERCSEEEAAAATRLSEKEWMTDETRALRSTSVAEANADKAKHEQETRATVPLAARHLLDSPSPSNPIGATRWKERLFSEADLTDEQRSVVELVLGGHHVYIGGSAGTGKSVLLRVLRRRLLEEGLSVAVTATTGLAAYHIGGTTLHHRFGITLDGRFLRPKALQEYDVIIIDEVSMLSRIVLEELECQLRQAHRNALPFGGVQIILCGDFMQLGAIAAPSVVQSPLFRHFFVMLKLMRSLRQEKHIGFYMHLQALRQGKMLPTWGRTVPFMDSDGHLLQENTAMVPVVAPEMEKRHPSRMDASLGSENVPPVSSPLSTSSLSSKVIFLPPLPSSSPLPEEMHTQSDPRTHSASSCCSTSSAAFSLARPITPPMIMEDAVNLLPTNALVRQANEVMLEKIQGEVVQFHSMSLSPFLQGKWSPSYLLRVTPSVSPSALHTPPSWSSLVASSPTPEEASSPVNTVDRAALLHHLQRFVLSCLSSVSSPPPVPSSRPTTTEAQGEEEDGWGQAVDDDQKEADDGIDWEAWRSHPERHMVLYPLYNDGLVFRVRLPSVCNGAPAKEEAFVSSLTNGLGDFLDALDMGVHRRDILPSGDGLHTDQDEFYLQQLTLRSPMAEPLLCKIGAKVMLRTNLSRTLVNGSLGTIVGFVEMKKEQLSSYLQHLSPSFRCNEGATSSSSSSTQGAVHAACHPYEASLEASIEQYADFLRFEHNFTTPVMPLVDFSGDGSAPPIAIPPVMFPVGGLESTHYYAGGVLRPPLSLAYAFTVHKVQGLTLRGRVHLELSQMWPCEHLLYVAMSRVKDPDQLSVSNFRMDVVRVDPDCLLFDRSLPSVDQAKILPHFIPATWVTDPRKRKRLLQRHRGKEKRRRKREKEEVLLSSSSLSQNWRRSRRQLARDIHVLQEKALAKLHRKDLRAGHATL